MSSVADTLITNYVLKDDYSANLAKISRQTQAFSKHAKQAQQATSGSGSGGGGSSLMGAFTALKTGITPVTAAITAVVGAVTAVAGVVGSMGAVAKNALETFAPYDTLERTFTGIYGSASKAKSMMGFLNQEAQKSNFLFTDLAQNAKLLALQGMKWSDYSDAIQALAIRGGGTGEALQMATSTVTRIKGGDYGEAFENLRQFGYSRDVLTQMGLVFDKAGSYKGTMEQALTAVKKIGQENKSIVDAMNGGAEATIGNLTESFTLAMADIGKSLFGYLKPFIEQFSTAIGDAINSGALGDMVDSIMAIFDPDPGSFSLNKVIASVIAGVETAAAWVKMVWGFVSRAFQVLAPIVKFLTGFSVVGLATQALGNPLEDTYKSSYDRAMSTLEAYQKRKAEEGDAAKEPEPKAAQVMATPLQQIADNTKATAKNTKESADMSRHIFGGGDLGRMGITPLEIRRANRGGGNSNVNVKIVGGDLNQILAAAITQAVAQMKRQGAI